MDTNFTRIRADEQLIFINTSKPIGLQSIDINNNFGLSHLNYLGIGGRKNFNIPSSEQVADVSINTIFIDSDPLIEYIQPSPINCFILKSQSDINNNFCLLSGYLSNYKSQFSIGQPIQVQGVFKFTKDAGKIDSSRLDAYSLSQLNTIQFSNYDYTGNYLCPNGNSIELTLNEALTNRVISYDLNINVNRLPTYYIGDRIPSKVDIIYPIEVSCNFSFEIGNYNPTQLQSLPKNQQNQDIGIKLYSNDTNQFLMGYKFKNMSLISENYANSVDGNVIVTKQYIGHFGKQDNSQDQNYNELTTGNLGIAGFITGDF